jgi:hypothetical protein
MRSSETPPPDTPLTMAADLRISIERSHVTVLRARAALVRSQRQIDDTNEFLARLHAVVHRQRRELSAHPRILGCVDEET